MKKLLIAVAMCAGIPALAQNAATTDTQTQSQTQVQPNDSATMRSNNPDLKSDMQQIGSDLNRAGMHVGRTAASTVQQTSRNLGLAPKDQATFKTDKAFTVVGTVQKASNNRVTITREGGLPPATLDVRQPTQITLNGQPWQAKNLQEGTQVRAKFQLDGTTPVAVIIEATPSASATTPKTQP